jgi:hypothetical protein
LGHVLRHTRQFANFRFNVTDMELPIRGCGSKPRLYRRDGFALVVTLSLMVLLTVIAVGLLGLSAITLRATSNEADMAQARANARLAMMMALGELQKQLGPDRAATATSAVLSEEPAKPHLAGVWESWDYNPASPGLDYASEKAKRFRAWLVSDREPRNVTSADYPTTPIDEESIVLAGARSLGLKDSAASDSRQFITAGRVPVSDNGHTKGAFAWHVSDESVKARINSYRDPSRNETLAQRRALLAGHRPDPTQIKTDDGSALSFLPDDSDGGSFDKARGVAPKLLSLGQVDLLESPTAISRFRHHVTPYSMGLPVNVREGGLKGDLSTMFGYSPTALPAAFNNRKLYASTHGITGPSDPNWSALKSYHDVYQESSLAAAVPVYYKAPPESIPLTQTNPPARFYPSPVIAKVELLFSFVVRDSHGPWVRNLASVDPQLTRMGHLLFAPIVTLHNPYNVPLKFDKLDLDIKGIPMAFNFVVNGKPQNNTLVPFNEFFVVSSARAEKSYYLSISNWSGFSSTTPAAITMNPGQVLVCGPYLDGNTVFGSDGNSGGSVFFDYRNDLTGTAQTPAKCKPGFLGRQVSYDVDWLTLSEYDAGQSTDGRLGVLGLRPNDRFYIEYGVKPCTGNVRDRMSVNARLSVGGTTREIGGLRFDYDETSLGKAFRGTFRYPDARSNPSTLLAEDLREPLTSPVKSHTKAKSFTLFSAYARTSNGGVYDNNSRDKIANGQNLQHDGRYAGRPFLHHNPARTPTVVDLKTDLPGRFSHELNLQPLPGHVDDLLNVDSTNRGYSLTANRTLRGVKSGSYLELPTGPLQTLADFRRSNALAGPQLPHFVQPVANSESSPLMATDKVIQTGVVRYPLLDHPVLANHALYDRFYFSTIAPFEGRSADQVFSSFMKGEAPLPAQSYEPYQPSGKTIEQARAELFVGGKSIDTAWQKAAEYQLVRGPFNVNSTDVQAWKAVLAAMNHSGIQTLWAATATAAESASEGVPLLPMSLVNAGKVGGFANNQAANIDNRLTNDLNGYRELSDDDLETLAQRIVEQVRQRGPFLSLSEFVNRRIGPDSPLTRTGALQAAIDEAKLNESFLAGSVTEVRPSDVSDPKTYGFGNPSASTGNPAAGAPGWIMQGDLMRVLEPGATVRSDTFVIRVCGETTNERGQVTARAYAETVVQRVPEFINPVDRPSVNVWSPSNTTASPENKTFGRRIDVVSFRWLAPAEI